MWEFAIEQRVPKCELFVSVRKRDVFVSCNKLRFLLTDVFFRLNVDFKSAVLKICGVFP